jgi:hypothetical protein
MLRQHDAAWEAIGRALPALKVSYLEGRKHLPAVELKAAA